LDLDVRPWLGEDVRDAAEPDLEEADRCREVDRIVELGHEVDPPVRIGRDVRATTAGVWCAQQDSNLRPSDS
jgi:hypothetical protein